MRSTVVVVVLLAILAGACGDDGDDGAVAVDDPTDTPVPTAVPSATVTPTPSVTATTGPDGLPPIADSEFVANAEPDTEEPAGGQAGWLDDIDFSVHDDFDRVVLHLSESPDSGAAPGWDARWVEAYVPIGEEDPPVPSGDALLQVTLRSVSLPFDDLDLAFPTGRFPGPGDAVLDLVNTGWFEGQQDILIGAPAEGPFRVYSDHPQRVIIEVGR